MSEQTHPEWGERRRRREQERRLATGEQAVAQQAPAVAVTPEPPLSRRALRERAAAEAARAAEAQSSATQLSATQPAPVQSAPSPAAPGPAVSVEVPAARSGPTPFVPAAPAAPTPTVSVPTSAPAAPAAAQPARPLSRRELRERAAAEAARAAAAQEGEPHPAPASPTTPAGPAITTPVVAAQPVAPAPTSARDAAPARPEVARVEVLRAERARAEHARPEPQPARPADSLVVPLLEPEHHEPRVAAAPARPAPAPVAAAPTATPAPSDAANPTAVLTPQARAAAIRAQAARAQAEREEVARRGIERAQSMRAGQRAEASPVGWTPRAPEGDAQAAVQEPVQAPAGQPLTPFAPFAPAERAVLSQVVPEAQPDAAPVRRVVLPPAGQVGEAAPVTPARPSLPSFQPQDQSAPQRPGPQAWGAGQVWAPADGATPEQPERPAGVGRGGAPTARPYVTPQNGSAPHPVAQVPAGGPATVSSTPWRAEERPFVAPAVVPPSVGVAAPAAPAQPAVQDVPARTAPDAAAPASPFEPVGLGAGPSATRAEATPSATAAFVRTDARPVAGQPLGTVAGPAGRRGADVGDTVVLEDVAPRWGTVAPGKGWTPTAAASESPAGRRVVAPVTAAVADETDEDLDQEVDEAPRHPYTWLHMIVLVVVAFVLGMLIFVVLLRDDAAGVEGAGLPGDLVTWSTAVTSELGRVL